MEGEKKKNKLWAPVLIGKKRLSKKDFESIILPGVEQS